MLPLSPTGRVSRASEEQEQSETQSVLWHSLALFFAAFYIFHTPYDAAFGGSMTRDWFRHYFDIDS